MDQKDEERDNPMGTGKSGIGVNYRYPYFSTCTHMNNRAFVLLFNTWNSHTHARHARTCGVRRQASCSCVFSKFSMMTAVKRLSMITAMIRKKVMK